MFGNIIRRDDDDDALFPIESIINGEYINASVTQLEAFSPRVQGMRKSQTRVYTTAFDDELARLFRAETNIGLEISVNFEKQKQTSL